MNAESAALLPDDFPAAEEILSRVEVEAGLDALAGGLQPVIASRDCILLGILQGGLYPLVKLSERLQGNFRLDTCHVTRYRGTTTGGQLEWLAPPKLDIANMTVIVVDDIYDAGTTLTAVAEDCLKRGANEALLAPLFIKDCARSAGVRAPDFVSGLTLPDRYVFGCGMDLHERWRHLSAVYALRQAGT